MKEMVKYYLAARRLTLRQPAIAAVDFGNVEKWRINDEARSG